MRTNETKINRLASGLGWFSIGLGLFETLAPRSVAKLIGVKEQPGAMRLMGLREIATGVGILSSGQKRSGWLWARVIGDAMDLTYLAGAPRAVNRRVTSGRPVDGQAVDGHSGRFAIATAAVVGVTALDIYCSMQLSRRRSIHVRKTILVERSPEELYAVWRSFEQLPNFMYHLKSVEQLDDNRWRWVANAPAGTSIEWDAEIINEKPNVLIAWRSLAGAEVDNAGTVRFTLAPGGRGTMVKVDLAYKPPAGGLGASVAKLFGEAPEQQIGAELRRFKQLMETGEIARTEGQPAGRATSTSKKYDLVQV